MEGFPIELSHVTLRSRLYILQFNIYPDHVIFSLSSAFLIAAINASWTSFPVAMTP